MRSGTVLAGTDGFTIIVLAVPMMPATGAIANESEFEMVVQGGVDRATRTDHEQRISVCGRAHDGLGSYVGTSTRPVLNDEWLAETLRQPLPHRTRNGVGIAASGKADQQAHRP